MLKALEKAVMCETSHREVLIGCTKNVIVIFGHSFSWLTIINLDKDAFVQLESAFHMNVVIGS